MILKFGRRIFREPIPHSNHAAAPANASESGYDPVGEEERTSLLNADDGFKVAKSSYCSASAPGSFTGDASTLRHLTVVQHWFDTLGHADGAS
jgi:hypothetical protein